MKKEEFERIFPLSRGTAEFMNFVQTYEMFRDMIDTDNLCHFLAQVAHESCDLKYKEELWKYSREALLRVFPKYFNSQNVDPYVRSPNALNRAYGNRMGNGDEASGDGFKYRGRGYIQLTGKNNYVKYGSDKIMDFLLTSEGAWEVSFKFWCRNKLYKLDNVQEITRLVNGGYNGLEHRKALYKKIKGILA